MGTVSIDGPRIFFTIPIFGGIDITETVINLFIVSGILLIGCLILTHKLEKIPKKGTQVLAEKLVMLMDGMVEETMGKKFASMTPFLMALFASSLLGSLVSFIGLRGFFHTYPGQ